MLGYWGALPPAPPLCLGLRPRRAPPERLNSWVAGGAATRTSLCLGIRPRRAPPERLNSWVAGGAAPRTTPLSRPPASPCAAQALKFSTSRDRTHARTQKERVPEEAESRVFSMSFDFFTGSRFFQKHVIFSKSRDRTHSGCQKERVPEEAKIGVFPKSSDFFTGSRVFPKTCNFSTHPKQNACPHPTREGP